MNSFSTSLPFSGISRAPIREMLPADRTHMKSVLFLCTGNYYRSRFAEELFNHRAERDGLRWAAYSRGLAIERGIFNVGPLSAHVLDALAERGLAPRSGNRVPQQCTRTDLQAADHIVALNEAEHRPLLIERFPEWEDRVEYWHIHDVTDTASAVALSSIADQIDLLVDRLV
jgi:protein-tyrosine phosphatase